MRPVIGFKRINAEGWKRVNGKVFSLYAKWDGKPMREPLKGEYFISGANPTAYKAKSDMTTKYYIAVICD